MMVLPLGQSALELVRFELRHGEDLLAADSIVGSDVSSVFSINSSESPMAAVIACQINVL